MKIVELDRLEDGMILEYKNNLDKIIDRMTDKEFKQMLLQRRWTSYYFTLLYDVGIDSMDNENAKKVLRMIRNEEYPQEGPSHREDLMHDLMLIGLDREDIINAFPSRQTSKIIQDQINFLKINNEMQDIKVLTFLRFALEVLVSAEYSVFVKRLEDFGLNRRNSKFYWPHYLHDMKQNPLGTKGKTHSDAIADVLVEMLDNLKKTDFCSRIMQKSHELRSDFFRQKF